VNVLKLSLAGLLILGCCAAVGAVRAETAAVPTLSGKALYEARCGGCHSIETDRVGPRHRGVVGRKAGKVPGFDYSPALQKAKFVWTPAKLDKWLQGPSKLVPGTKMFFTVSAATDRTAIIAYLATQK
jgi:cytochrome c